MISLTININELESLEELDHHSYKYYRLPMKISGCDLLMSDEYYDGSTTWALGVYNDDRSCKMDIYCWLGYMNWNESELDISNARKEGWT